MESGVPGSPALAHSTEPRAVLPRGGGGAEPGSAVLSPGSNEGFLDIARQEESLQNTLEGMKSSLTETPSWSLRGLVSSHHDGETSPEDRAASKDTGGDRGLKAENTMLKEALRQSEMALGRMKLENDRAMQEAHKSFGPRAVSDVATSAGELRRLRHELADTTTKAKEREIAWAKERQQLLRQLEDRQGQVVALQRYYDEEQEKKDSLKDQHGNLVQEVAAAADQLNNSNARVQQLEKELKTIKRRNAEMQRNHSAEAALIKGLKQEVQLAQQETERVKQEAVVLQTQQEEGRKNGESVDTEVVKAELAQVKEEATRYLQQLTIAQADFSEKENAKNLQIKAVQTQLQTARGRILELEQALARATTSHDSSAQALISAQQKCDYLMDELADFKVASGEDIKRLQAEIERSQVVITQLQAEKSMWQEEQEVFHAKLRSAQADIGLLTETNQSLMNDKERLTVESKLGERSRHLAHDLEDQLHEAVLKIDAGYRYNQAREQEVEHIRLQMATLAHELKRVTAHSRDMAVIAQKLAGEWEKGVENSVPCQGVLRRLERGVSMTFVRDIREVRLLLEELIEEPSAIGGVGNGGTLPTIRGAARKKGSSRVGSPRKHKSSGAATSTTAPQHPPKSTRRKAGADPINTTPRSSVGQHLSHEVIDVDVLPDQVVHLVNQTGSMESEGRGGAGGKKGRSSKPPVSSARRARPRSRGNRTSAHKGSKSARRATGHRGTGGATGAIKPRPPSASTVGGSGAMTARMHPLDEKRRDEAMRGAAAEEYSDRHPHTYTEVDLPPLDLHLIAQAGALPGEHEHPMGPARGGSHSHHRLLGTDDDGIASSGGGGGTGAAGIVSGAGGELGTISDVGWTGRTDHSLEPLEWIRSDGGQGSAAAAVLRTLNTDAMTHS